MIVPYINIDYRLCLVVTAKLYKQNFSMWIYVSMNMASAL